MCLYAIDLTLMYLGFAHSIFPNPPDRDETCDDTQNSDDISNDPCINDAFAKHCAVDDVECQQCGQNEKHDAQHIDDGFIFPRPNKHGRKQHEIPKECNLGLRRNRNADDLAHVCVYIYSIYAEEN